MELNFKDKRLRELCEQSRIAEKRLGADSARKLKSRLSDIQAAASVSDLAAGNPHPLKGDRKNQYSVSLAGGCRITFEPDHDPFPLREDQSIDWSQVRSVKIVFIGDYHE
ncbi:type II toxin-antitoxin system RelE/ParE family toxin [Pseudomonas sp. ZB1P45]|uniref:type II toxin-antitoxin system RelE/ParE family toxin n=1 Tax=Pseudomonas frigoris TaxID=3398356 RepID=UPI0039EE61AF